MLQKVFAISVIALVIVSPLANAYTVISKDTVRGTVVKVDAERGQLVLRARSGAIKSIDLSQQAKVVLMDDTSGSLHNLKKGHQVTINKHFQTKENSLIEGQIVGVDSESKTARIRKFNSGQTVSIQFGENVRVVDSNEVVDFEHLRRGQNVSIRSINQY